MGTRADEYNHGRVVTQLATITLDRRRRRPQALLAEPVAHGDAVPDPRRPRRLLALGAPRERQRREALRDEPGLHADGRARRPARQAGELAGAGHRSRTSRTCSTAIATERENTIQAGSLVQLDARSALDGAVFDEEKRAGPGLHQADARGSGRRRSLGQRRSLPRAGGAAERRRAGVVGRRPRERDQRAVRTPPGLRHLHLRHETSASRSSCHNYEDTWELYAKPVVLRAGAASSSRRARTRSIRRCPPPSARSTST